MSAAPERVTGNACQHRTHRHQLLSTRSLSRRPRHEATPVSIRSGNSPSSSLSRPSIIPPIRARPAPRRRRPRFRRSLSSPWELAKCSSPGSRSLPISSFPPRRRSALDERAATCFLDFSAYTEMAIGITLNLLAGEFPPLAMQSPAGRAGTAASVAVSASPSAPRSLRAAMPCGNCFRGRAGRRQIFPFAIARPATSRSASRASLRLDEQALSLAFLSMR